MATVVLKYVDIDGMICFEKPVSPYREKMQSVIDVCKQKFNGYVCVDISKPRKKRTLPENSLFWALVTLIANEVGDDSEKMIDTENGIKYRAMGRGYPFHINKITGEKVPNSTTTVDTVQMAGLIDTAMQVCAELGIVVPPNIKGA